MPLSVFSLTVLMLAQDYWHVIASPIWQVALHVRSCRTVAVRACVGKHTRGEQEDSE